MCIRDSPEPVCHRSIEELGYNKVAFEVSDLSQEIERLSKHGIEPLSAPTVSVDGIEICLRDPDGNLVSLIQPNEETGLSVSRLKQKTW